MRGYVVRVTRVGRRTDVVVPRDARQRVIRGRAIPQFRREPRVWHLLTAGINPREVSVPRAFLASDSGELARIGLPKAPHGLVVHGDPAGATWRVVLPAACPISTIVGIENPVLSLERVKLFGVVYLSISYLGRVVILGSK